MQNHWDQNLNYTCLSGEHCDVEEVEYRAEDADDEAEVAVDALVRRREPVQVAAHPV